MQTEYQKQYYIEHKKQKAEYTKNYRKKHKEQVLNRSRKYRETHKDRFKQYLIEYRKQHRLERSQYNKKYKELHKEETQLWVDLNREKLKQYGKKYRKEHALKNIEYQKNYYLDEIHREERREYQKNKRKLNINFRLSMQLRSRLNCALKNNKRTLHTLELIGCSIEFLKQHLEKQFTRRIWLFELQEMSWDNYGKWEVDHIKPCASFDLSKPEEQLKCFHYTNLQPLWAEDNLKKSNKY